MRKRRTCEARLLTVDVVSLSLSLCCACAADIDSHFPSWLDDAHHLPLIDVLDGDSDEQDDGTHALLSSLGYSDDNTLLGDFQLSTDDLPSMLGLLPTTPSASSAPEGDEDAASSPWPGMIRRVSSTTGLEPSSTASEGSLKRKRPSSTHSQQQETELLPFPGSDSSRIIRPTSASPSSNTRAKANAVAAWSEQEQSVFFSLFKSKWIGLDQQAGVRPQQHVLDTLLLQRFDAISKKVKTKTVNDVRLFYSSVLHKITQLLKEQENDIDLTNLDEVRIAVWCWHKLLTDPAHKDSFQAIDSAEPAVRTKLAHVLLQSIIRSRRQMLKARASTSSNSAAVSATSAYTAIKPETVAPILTLQQAQNAFAAALIDARPIAMNTPAPVVIHHPTVRKKKTVLHAALIPPKTNSSPSLKRKRAESIGVTPITVGRHADSPEVLLLSPPAVIDSGSRMNCQTPPRSARKKISIKMRIVPMDEQTKAYVAQSGCNPKVELKLSSTKKISDVAEHMTAKWSGVREHVPAHAVLRFFQSGKEASESNAGWSTRDNHVTCFDIWKACGKKVKNENVVSVSYAWICDNNSNESTPAAKITPTVVTPLKAPTGLSSESAQKRKKRKIADSPAKGLQQFGENMAFNLDDDDDDEVDLKATALVYMPLPEDENLVEQSPSFARRRITPMLVSKQEFNI